MTVSNKALSKYYVRLDDLTIRKKQINSQTYLSNNTDRLIMTTMPTLPNFLRQKTYFINSSKAMAKINTRVVTAIIYIVDNTSVLTSEVT